MEKSVFPSFPYLIWSCIFIVAPLLLVTGYAVTVPVDGGFAFSPENLQRFMEPVYLKVLLRSVKLALLCTVFCFLLGYPAAFILSRAAKKTRTFLILFFILPTWMNSLLRTYAWMSILERSGIINSFLNSIGIGTIDFMYREGTVVLGMVYNFMPFMVLPIYAVLTKMNKNLIEAAYDLGADSFTVFRKIIFPLSLPGVISGTIMVFMPSVTTFVISRLLGGGQFALIGNLIEQQFITVGDWHFGSAISMIMMVLILVSTAFLSRYEKREERGGGLF